MSLNLRLAVVGTVAFFMTVWAAPGRGDTVYLKDGVQKEGKILEETDDEVVLEMTIIGMKASLHIKKDEIDHIERTKSRKESLADEEGKLEANDADGWHKLGLKYKAVGEVEEAKRCFGKALRANPQHEGAAKEMGGVSIEGH